MKPLKTGKCNGPRNWHDKTSLPTKLSSITLLGVRPLQRKIKSSFFDPNTMMAFECLCWATKSYRDRPDIFKSNAQRIYKAGHIGQTTVAKIDDQWFMVLAVLRTKNELFEVGIQEKPSFNKVYVLGKQITNNDICKSYNKQLAELEINV